MVTLWIERKPGAIWAVGRAVNPQHRDCWRASDRSRPSSSRLSKRPGDTFEPVPGRLLFRGETYPAQGYRVGRSIGIPDPMVAAIFSLSALLWAASSPFLFFADHNPDLAKLVRKGRAEFLTQFPSVALGEVQATLHDPSDDPHRAAANFVDPDRDVPDAGAALDGARAILVERFAEDADLLGELREAMAARGSLTSAVR